MSLLELWPPKTTLKHPHQLYVHLPMSSQDGKLDQYQLGRWSEDLVGRLYETCGWTIAKRRFRLRGSEIDLAVVSPNGRDARIIEVKARRHSASFKSTEVEDLISTKKVKSLKHGALSLFYEYEAKGLSYHWCFDVVMVTPEVTPGRHLITTWTDAFSMYD